jgi:hypothetical protein
MSNVDQRSRDPPPIKGTPHVLLLHSGLRVSTVAFRQDRFGSVASLPIALSNPKMAEAARERTRNQRLRGGRVMLVSLFNKETANERQRPE